MRRRHFLRGAALAAAAGGSADRPPIGRRRAATETTRLRLVRIRACARRRKYVAETLLNAEASPTCSTSRRQARWASRRRSPAAEANINNHFVAPSIMRAEAGDPILFLGGSTSAASSWSEPSVSARFATSRQERRRPGAGWQPARFRVDHARPRRSGPAKGRQLGHQPSCGFYAAARGRKIDAFLGFPPEPRSCTPARSVTSWSNSTLDRPWSQYLLHDPGDRDS